jgi:hypothetical protein
VQVRQSGERRYTQRMDLVAFPFQQRPCPNCASLADSAILDARDPRSHGTSFVFYDCVACGQLVYRILQFDMANSTMDNSLLLEPVESDEQIAEVIRASVGAP